MKLSLACRRLGLDNARPACKRSAPSFTDSRGTMKRTLSAALLVVALAACVRTNATMLGSATAQRPALVPDSVRIYRTAAQVPGKYEEVALLNATGEASWTDENKMMNAMRKKAASLGANAVILDAISEPSAGAKVAGAVFGTGAQRKGKAIAVWVFPDSSGTK